MRTITVDGIKIKIDDKLLNSMRFTMTVAKANKSLPKDTDSDEYVQVAEERGNAFLKMVEMLFCADDIDRINDELDAKSEHKYATNQEFCLFVDKVIEKANLKK